MNAKQFLDAIEEWNGTPLIPIKQRAAAQIFVKHDAPHKIFVVQAEHFEVPGLMISAHTTRMSAVDKAVELTNSILRDWDDDLGPVGPENWEDHPHMAGIQDEHPDCYVEITEVELRP